MRIEVKRRMSTEITLKNAEPGHVYIVKKKPNGSDFVNFNERVLIIPLYNSTITVLLNLNTANFLVVSLPESQEGFLLEPDYATDSVTLHLKS